MFGLLHPVRTHPIWQITRWRTHHWNTQCHHHTSDVINRRHGGCAADCTYIGTRLIITQKVCNLTLPSRHFIGHTATVHMPVPANTQPHALSHITLSSVPFRYIPLTPQTTLLTPQQHFQLYLGKLQAAKLSTRMTPCNAWCMQRSTISPMQAQHIVVGSTQNHATRTARACDQDCSHNNLQKTTQE